MSNLKEVKISDLAEKIASGGTPSTKTTSYYDGGIPWLNTKEINFNRITQTERTISNEGLTNSSAKWIKENSVIVAMYGATAAKVAINKIPLTTNQACCNITLNPSLADYNYIYYRLFDCYHELENLAVGAAQQNLNVGTIADFVIQIHDLKEQHAIAIVLGSLDDKIDLLHRQNKTLEALAETLFRQWFVEEADDNFRTEKLGNIAEVQNGFSFSSKDYVAYQFGHLEVFKMGHIQKGGGLRTDPKRDYVPRDNRLKKWILNKGDIVMAMTDMKDNVVILGVPAMIDKDDNYVLNQRVASVSRNDVIVLIFKSLSSFLE